MANLSTLFPPVNVGPTGPTGPSITGPTGPTGPAPDTSSFVTTSGTQTLTNKTINGSNNTITNISLSTSVTGTLPVASGGTGQTSLTANNVILGNGTSAVQFVAPGTSGNVLTSNGSSWVSQASSGGAAPFVAFGTSAGF